MARALAIDEREALEAERDFLLSSLDDLEREHVAGDVGDDDYDALRDDYTARAARLVRVLDAGVVRDPAGAKSPWARRLLWLTVVAVVGVGTGLVLARSLGGRNAGETATGDIRSSIAGQLQDAQVAMSEGDLDRAVEIYGEVIDTQPTNAEALAYRGWISFQQGDTDSAGIDLEDAIASSPDYPDARVFGAVVALRGGDLASAAENLTVFDQLDPPPVMQQLVSQFGVRSEIAAGLLAEGSREQAVTVLAPATAPELLAVALAGADPVAALQLIDEVAAADPSNAVPVATRGWILADSALSARDQGLTEDYESLAAGAADALDQAVALDPSSPDALALRAVTRLQVLDDPAGAAADLEAYVALDAGRVDLDQRLRDDGLFDSPG